MNFIESFYKDFFNGIDFSLDKDFEQQLVNNSFSEDVKKFLLATSDLAKKYKGSWTYM